jgi:3-methylcrotonyl-CoA carboxylase alpha subunit
MPGKVVTLIAEPGVVVEKGAPLLVLEAMKMEHTITAPRKGRSSAFMWQQAIRSPTAQSLLNLKEPKHDRRSHL